MGETTVAGFFADKAHYFAAVFIEDNDGYSKGKILEVLTHAEEISGEVVIHKELVNVVFDLLCALVGIIAQSGTVADFGIELLTGGERFIIFYLRDDVVRHHIVRSPRYEFHSVGQCAHIEARVFPENGAAVRHESNSRFSVGQEFY